MMRHNYFTILFLLTALIGSLSASPIEITGVAATVNGKVITIKEVRGLLAPTITLLKTKYPRGGEIAKIEFEKAQEKVLTQLIENKIILSELEERGASIPDYIVDQEVKRIITNYFNGREIDFRKSLSESGTTMRSFRATQKEKILVQALKSEQFGKDLTPPTSNELKAQYKKSKLNYRDKSKDSLTFSKIFIPARSEDPDSTPESQLNFADSLVLRLKKGDDFAETAKKHSADAYAEEGGAWPATIKSDLEPSFAELLSQSPLNKVQGPYKDPRGFTIVKVTNKVYGDAPPLSEIKDKLKKEIESDKYQAKYSRWIETLKKKAIIDRRM